MSKNNLHVGRVSPSGVTRQAPDVAADANVGLRYANPTYTAYADMGRTITLGEFAEINPKRALTKGKTAPFVEMAALPTFSRDIADVAERTFTGSGAKFTNGDTLLARITPCLENGKTALVSCLSPLVNGHGSTEFIVLAPRSSADQNFLYYLARSDDFRTYAISRMEGTSGRQRVPNNAVGQYSFFCPPKSERKGIGDLLATLDDRIALLRETNTTLEAIAQALFKSWFVDFDPVHAKQQGREPEGMDDDTAALFPDSFEESELGLVPSGWMVGNIGDNTIYMSRGISPKYLDKGGVLVINQKCIRDFILDISKARRHDPVQRKIDGRELFIGDILVNSTGVGTLGRVAQVLSSVESMIVDSHVTVVRASKNLTWNYLGLSMMRRQAEIENLGEGSTGQTELSRSKLAALKLIIPPQEILHAFDEIALPLRQRFAANLKQAQTLATLRDTLLPRLISGQLRLPDAEVLAEDAGA